METILYGIDQLILQIDKVVNLVVIGDCEKLNQEKLNFFNNYIKFLPQMLETYQREELKSVAEDATYWTAQAKRILTTIENDDYFSVIDILKFETKENLLLYRQMIEKF